MTFELKLIGISGYPTSHFEIYDDKVHVGMCLLHHRLQSEMHLPEDFSGHIYYNIFPKFRGSGYAKKALDKLLSAAKNIGLHEVFLVSDKENIAALAVIQGRGAELVSEALGADGRNYARYKIELK
jgi:predicted acetyltransferase